MFASRKVKILAATAVVVAMGFAAYAIVKRHAAESPDISKMGLEEPSYVWDGEIIYVNTAPNVKYVGSEKCGVCHAKIYESFSRSEMGGSMARLDSTNIIEQYPQKKAVYDSSKNYYYEMVKRTDGFYQREYRLDADGHLIHERWMKAEYVMGSGNNLRMYFHDENGMFYELPLTWYVHKKRWDLSPGYRDFSNLRFSRFATDKCISCHNAFMKVAPMANDRYVKPYPLGISCERCHGPGELHIKQVKGEDLGFDNPNVRTIVNPAKLSPERQMDVCRQCHLQGKVWALRSGKDWFDFRPGMRLATHRSVYTTAKTRKEVFEVADSALRLVLSRCYKESNGTLTCISCHDPHYSIKTFSKQHYNDKCQTCHAPQSLPGRDTGYPHSAGDDCVSCHMNRTGTDNTLHGVSNTDHWIRTNANEAVIDWSILKLPPDKRPAVQLVAALDSDDDTQAIRKGIAYFTYYKSRDTRAAYLDSALIYLSQGLQQVQDDPEAFFYLGKVQNEFGRYFEAVTAFKRALALNPDYAEAHFALGNTHLVLRESDKAIAEFRQAVALMPDEPAYLESLGNALLNTGSVAEARDILERSLGIDKQNPYTFYTLGNLCALNLRDFTKALPYYKQAIALDPDMPNGYLNLGNSYSMLGDYQSAIDAYQREFALRPNSPNALVNLGRVYSLMGRPAAARDAFERALEIDPSQPLARKYLDESTK